MYYNGKSNGIHVHHFMNLVHESMKEKYSNQNSSYTNDINQAKMLQNFFQDIKAVASGGQANVFDQVVLQDILNNLSMNNSFLRSDFLVKNLFSTRGGSAFERQLSAIIETVMTSVGTEDFEFDKHQVLISSTTGTTINAEEIDLSDKAIQKFLSKIGTKAQRYIEQETNNMKTKQYYLPDVSGKIDVKGYSIAIRADANPKLVEIYNLLKDATFSAKNYDSMTRDQKIGEWVAAAGRNVLHLGKSNIFRSIYGALQDFTTDSKTAQSAIFAGYNAIAKGNADVANHFYHLRYLYELTGAGILYNGQSYGHVRFLIFNDPHGGIYVKSTSELFSDIIDEILTNKGQWSRAITISKEKFY